MASDNYSSPEGDQLCKEYHKQRIIYRFAGVKDVLIPERSAVPKLHSNFGRRKDISPVQL